MKNHNGSAGLTRRDALKRIVQGVTAAAKGLGVADAGRIDVVTLRV